MKRILLLFVGLLVLGSGLGLMQGNQTRLRVAHLSPDAPAVDVWVNGVRVLSRVSYKNVGAYLTVRGGVNRVWVMPDARRAGHAAAHRHTGDARARPRLLGLHRRQYGRQLARGGAGAG